MKFNFCIALLSILALVQLARAVGKGERCSDTIPCDYPYSCVGNPKNLRCFEKRGLDEKCGKDPFWVCDDGLACVDKSDGEMRCVVGKDKAERCGPTWPCGEPLSCVGNPSNMRCFAKRTAGQKCGKDPFWVCEDYLVCDDTDHRCKTSTSTAGDRCGNSVKCTPPLSCVGNKKNLRCWEKRKLGEKCGKDPFWVCEDGLACDDGTCVDGVDKGERCSDDMPCGEPLDCVGNPGNLRCFKKRGLKEKCGKDPFWVCEEKLICDEGVCKKTSGIGGRCDTPTKACRDSLECEGGRCAVPSPEM